MREEEIMKIIQKEVKFGREKGDNEDIITARIKEQVSKDKKLDNCLRMYRLIDECIGSIKEKEEVTCDFDNPAYNGINSNKFLQYLLKELRSCGFEEVYYIKKPNYGVFTIMTNNSTALKALDEEFASAKARIDNGARIEDNLIERFTYVLTDEKVVEYLGIIDRSDRA